MCRLVRLPSSGHVSEVLGVLEGDAVVLLLRGDVRAISVTSVVDVPSRQVGVAIVGQIRRHGSGEQSFHRHLLAELPMDCALRCATQQNDPALHRGSEHFGSGRFLVLLHQVNTSWRHENKDWLRF